MLPGVRIGHGAVIASGAVVVDDVPDYGVVGGSPATLLRRRFDDEHIALLLDLAWWDWPLEHLTAHIRAVMPGSVEALDAVAPARP